MGTVETSSKERARQMLPFLVCQVKLTFMYWCENSLPSLIGCIGKPTQPLIVVAVCKCDLVGERTLASLKCVRFGLSSVQVEMLFVRNGALDMLAHMIVDVLHEFVQQSKEGIKLG